MDKQEITVRKLDINGEETWRYTGTVIECSDTRIILKARFNRSDVLFYDIWLRNGDMFIETFYSNRWYNFFEIHDQDTGEIKGWYCNIGFPAEFCDAEISYRDLALDLLVYPNGKQLLVDEDEFARLTISDEIRKMASESLHDLQALFSTLPPIV